MRVLIACEFSGIVREAFRKRGHDAWSCDLLDTEIPGQHIEGDVLRFLKHNWDLMIAHPPCTRLCNSGVKHLYSGGKKLHGLNYKNWEDMKEAAYFFQQLWCAPIKKICIENPIMHGYAKNFCGCGKQSQIIQPWMFGHDASKQTCLWLKGLPNLEPTNLVTRPAWIPCPDGCDDFMCQRHGLHTADCDCPELDDWVLRGDDPYKVRYANQTPSGQNNLGPSPTRSADRSRTYQGIADAMAEQLG